MSLAMIIFIQDSALFLSSIPYRRDAPYFKPRNLRTAHGPTRPCVTMRPVRVNI